MADEPRPAPQVTVSDPARPRPPVDLLEVEPRRVGRRTLTAGAAAAAAVVLLVAGLEVREDRAAAAQERRLQAVVDLEVQIEGASSVYDPGTRAARLESRLRVVNDGPRDHVVEEGSLGAFRLVRAGIPVRAGRSTSLVLGASVPCTSRRPAEPASGPLVLRLEGGRTVELPVDDAVGPDAAARACGFIPLEEVGFLGVLGASRAPGALELAVDLGTQAVRAVEVTALRVGPGLRGELRRGDGTPVTFPLPLPTGDGPGFVTQGYTLRIEVTDCAAARAGAGSPSIGLSLRAADGETAKVETLYDLDQLADLLRDAC